MDFNQLRVIDCNILDGSVPENIIIQRIQKAVEAYHGVSKIYNLSANASLPIEGDEMSIIGFELDVPYALVATIEDVSGTLDVYSEIQAQNRYQLANTLRIKVDA